MLISKILDFSAGSKFAIRLSQDMRYDQESKTVIEFYFLFPDFKSRGHPADKPTTIPTIDSNKIPNIIQHFFFPSF